MNNPILTAFANTDILIGFDHFTHRIIVRLDGRSVGEVSPERNDFSEAAYAWDYKGVTRGRDGVTPIGPAFDQGTMKRRIISVMFNGDAEAFERAVLEIVKR